MINLEVSCSIHEGDSVLGLFSLRVLRTIFFLRSEAKVKVKGGKWRFLLCFFLDARIEMVIWVVGRMAA